LSSRHSPRWNIGTYLKALAAMDNGVPFYVALPSSTFDWSMRDGLREIPIEQRGGEEVKFAEGWHDGELKKVLVAPEKSPAAIYGFDVTRPPGDRADHGTRHLSGQRRRYPLIVSRAAVVIQAI